MINKASFFFLLIFLISCGGGGNSTQPAVQNTNVFDACQFDSCVFSE